jgi:hypothetical protein
MIPLRMALEQGAQVARQAVAIKAVQAEVQHLLAQLQQQAVVILVVQATLLQMAEQLADLVVEMGKPAALVVQVLFMLSIGSRRYYENIRSS